MNEQKKCPYCSAPIQENASFCLHCMKSLDKKTVIEKKQPKKIFIVAGLILLAIFTCFILMLCLNRKHNKNTSENNNEQVLSITNFVNTQSNSSEYINGNEEKSEIPNNTEKPSDEKNSSDGKNKETDIKENAESKNNDSGEKTDKNTEPQNSGSDSTANHTHSYISEVTNAATCGKDGKIQYTCSCGDTYTEIIPATQKHNWTAETETVHHNEVGHYENIQKRKPVTKYQCGICNKKFDSLDAYYSHFDNIHTPLYQGDPITILRDRYDIINDFEYYYENVWVIDKAAYDETVVKNYICSYCGAIKQ